MKSRHVVILALLALILVLGIAVCNSSDTTTSRVRATSAPVTYQVKYLVLGSTNHASLTYENETGNTEQRTVKVPWEMSFTASRGQFLYVSAQNENKGGTIKCQIIVNGQITEQAESRGAYVIAGCSGSAGR